MKKDMKPKSKLWLWLLIGALVLAAVGATLFFVFSGTSNGKQNAEEVIRADLYWNVDRLFYTENSESGLSNREPAEDGVYYIRFAYNGAHVELPIVDKQLVNYIDSLSLMGLVFDDGVVVDAVDPREVATEIAFEHYFQKAQGNDLVFNSSLTMNGMQIQIAVCELTEIYDVSGVVEPVGKILSASELKPMDRVTAYTNSAGQLTHVFLDQHPVESAIYWRTVCKYNSTEKSTTREAD
ncbi:MAG: hypothetical protein IKU07_05455, partial [Oscillospiraceae bacterium]|nr:hypothetical protein [Oscillospiraceae bacterium]